MARSTITTPAPARVATAYDRDGDTLGAIDQETTPFEIARPSVIPGASTAGAIPLTVTLPAGAISVLLWSPSNRVVRTLSPGANTVRPADFGLPGEMTSRVVAFVAAFGEGGAWSGWFPIHLIWTEREELPAPPNPVTLASAGSLGNASIVGETLTVVLQSYGGDLEQREDWIETAATEGGAVTVESPFWTTLPDQPGRWYRYGSRAYGSTVANPMARGWTAAVYTEWRQIQAIPAARRILAEDVEFAEVNYDPVGQNTTFTPTMAFPGLAGETIESMQYTAADTTLSDPLWTPMAPASGEWSLGVGDGARHRFRIGDPRQSRLRFRWRGAANQPWSEASPTFTVPAPVSEPDNDLKAIFNPTAAQATASATSSSNSNRYYIRTPVGGGGGDPSTPVYAKWDVFLPMLYCWAGNNGNITMNGSTKAAVEHMVDLLLFWASDSGVNAPAARSGYHGQHEMRFVATVALARITPAVWNHPRLNAAPKYKQRLDFVMKGCLVANMIIAASERPPEFPRGYGANYEASIRGWSAGASNVPNFSSPPHLTPHVVAAYMAENGEDAQAWVIAFNRDTFSAAMEAVGGINECRATFRQDWTNAHHISVYGTASTFGRGWTKKEIEDTLKSFGTGVWTSVGGDTLAQSAAAFVREIGERAFSRVVRPGPMNAMNPLVSGGSSVNWGLNGPESPFASQKYGILCGKSATGAHNLTQPLRGCLGARLSDGSTDRSRWADLPNPGAIGMHIELDATDGGGSGRPNERSAMSYAVSGFGAVLIGFVTMICYGKFSPEDVIWTNSGGIDTRSRFQVGVRDLNFRSKVGHRSYAKGGPSASNNEDWGPAFISSNGVKWASAMVLCDMVAEWWGLPPFPTDD